MQLNSALEYDYSIAKLFLFATIVFGIVGLLLGVIIAFQMAFPNLNYLVLPLVSLSISYEYNLSNCSGVM